MGASAAINMKWVGQGPSGSGQIIADQTSGPKAKTLYGYGTLVSGSDATTAAVNWIDGVQSLGKTIVLNLQSAAAAATINGVANQQVLYSTGGDGQIHVGDTVSIQGFASAGNANTAVPVTAVGSTYVQVTNSTGVAEVNPAATLVDVQGGLPVWVDVFYAGNPGGLDSSTAAGIFATGANHFQPSAVTTTGFTLNYPTVTTSAVTIQFGAIVAFSS